MNRTRTIALEQPKKKLIRLIIPVLLALFCSGCLKIHFTEDFDAKDPSLKFYKYWYSGGAINMSINPKAGIGFSGDKLLSIVNSKNMIGVILEHPEKGCGLFNDIVKTKKKLSIAGGHISYTSRDIYNVELNGQQDLDADGYSDCDELFVYHTDPTDPGDTPEFCGDGVVQPHLGEICDGDVVDCVTAEGYNGKKACSDTCTEYGECVTEEFCGDTVCNGLENGLTCEADCPAVCGNGIIEGEEECDDGNLDFGDGCSELCLKEVVKMSIETDKALYELEQLVMLTSKDKEKKIRGSMIFNKSESDISGYLMAKIIKHEDGEYKEVATVVDDGNLTTIAAKKKLPLAPIFKEAGGFSSDSDGKYQVYMALRDKDGEILMDSEDFVDDSDGFRILMEPWEGLFEDGALTDIAKDSLGNLFVVGYINRPQKMSGFAKFNKHGELLWTKFLDDKLDMTTGVKIDADDNVYLSGYFNNQPCVRKHGNDGEMIWEKVFDHGTKTSEDTANALSLGADGTIHVVGDYKDASGKEHFWLHKLDKDGNMLLSKRFKNGSAADVDVDKKGRTFIFGHSGDSLKDFDWHVTVLNKKGKVALKKIYKEKDADIAESIAVDEKGNAYLIGSKTHGKVPSRWHVMKINKKGKILWNHVDPEGTSTGKDVMLHSSGSVYCLGMEDGEWKSVRLEPKKGVMSWSKSFGALEPVAGALNEDLHMMFVVGSKKLGQIRVSGIHLPMDETPPDFELLSTLEIQDIIGIVPPPIVEEKEDDIISTAADVDEVVTDQAKEDDQVEGDVDGGGEVGKTEGNFVTYINSVKPPSSKSVKWGLKF